MRVFGHFHHAVWLDNAQPTGGNGSRLKSFIEWGLVMSAFYIGVFIRLENLSKKTGAEMRI